MKEVCSSHGWDYRQCCTCVDFRCPFTTRVTTVGLCRFPPTLNIVNSLGTSSQYVLPCASEIRSSRALTLSLRIYVLSSWKILLKFSRVSSTLRLRMDSDRWSTSIPGLAHWVLRKFLGLDHNNLQTCQHFCEVCDIKLVFNVTPFAPD